MEDNNIICESCLSEFVIDCVYSEYDKPTFCSYCGEDLSCGHDDDDD